MAVDKCCAESERVLQAKSAANKIKHVKNTFAENFAKSSKCMHKRMFVAMSLLQYYKCFCYFAIIVLLYGYCDFIQHH